MTDSTSQQTNEKAGSVEPRMPRSKRWNRLKSIKVENFKAVKNAEIPIANVTLLVGTNGSGKSSVLQAIHWAARATSYIKPKNATEVIAFDRLDYLPSSDPLKTGHGRELKNGGTTPATKLTFTHEAEADGGPTQATVKIRAARNKSGISVNIEGGSAVTPYKQRDHFITAYIPGLAGLAERETLLAQPYLRRQAASGDAGGVLRNILWNIKKASQTDDLKLLEDLVTKIHPEISLAVTFNDREDYHILATYSKGASINQPLETLATGVLQVIQIFAYLILFRPQILLIDEPDAHLHPDRQERLIKALESAAEEFNTQIILTTHSPHIVRAASYNTKIVWMRDGGVEQHRDKEIRRLLGWGGLDKKLLFFVEDEDSAPLQAILSQWPDLERDIALCPCFGVENLPKDRLLRGLLGEDGLKMKALIHRDRDFMTEAEIQAWKDLYKTDGSAAWVTSGADVEAYFCSADYLSALYGISLEVAEDWRRKASERITKAKDAFLSKRASYRTKLWPHGGGPNDQHLWEELGRQSPLTVIGKDLWKQLKVIAKESQHKDALLNKYSIPKDFELAADLKETIRILLAP